MEGADARASNPPPGGCGDPQNPGDNSRRFRPKPARLQTKSEGGAEGSGSKPGRNSREDTEGKAPRRDGRRLFEGAFEEHPDFQLHRAALERLPQIAGGEHLRVG